MNDRTQVILLNAVPLLVLAALYLGVAGALAPELLRRRRFSWLGLGIWMLVFLVGALAGVVGLLEAEEAATERHREADSITRLSSALLQVQTAREAAERLFEELESTTGVEVALLLKVDEDERRASGFAARGVDESWLSWRDGLQGTGLGLFLSRGLLAAMRGRIWVESKEGEGSIFAFELPVASQAPVGMEEMEAAGRS